MAVQVTFQLKEEDMHPDPQYLAVKRTMCILLARNLMSSTLFRPIGEVICCLCAPENAAKRMPRTGF